MDQTLFSNILLLALWETLGDRENATIAIDDIATAVRRLELESRQLHGGHEPRVAIVLKDLEAQHLVRLDSGRASLTQTGINTCRGNSQTADWVGLPAYLKPHVKAY